MTPEEKAKELGIDLSPQDKGYLNLCIRSGNLLITSGHVSDLKGILGKDLDVDQGYEAAKNCAEKILRSVHTGRHHLTAVCRNGGASAARQASAETGILRRRAASAGADRSPGKYRSTRPMSTWLPDQRLP